MKKVFSLVMAALLTGTLLAGCAGQTPATSSSTTAVSGDSSAAASAESSTPAASGEAILIGYSLNSMDSTMKQMADFFQETAKSKGWEPVLLNANGDVTTELTNVESLINMGCKAVVIMGCDTEGTAAAVKACADAGIPCIIAGRKINAAESDYYTYVAGDHHMAGEVQAKFVNDYLAANPTAKLNVGFIYGQSGSSSVAARYQGFADGCLNLPANADRVKLVAEQYAEFDAEKAYNITTDMLQTYPDINCFVTQTDDQAGGIINAIKAQGRDVNSYLIVSIDCSSTGITYLKSGELDATVLMAMRQLAVSAADYAEKAIKGETVEKSNPIPEYYQLATAENVDAILKAAGMA